MRAEPLPLSDGEKRSGTGTRTAHRACAHAGSRAVQQENGPMKQEGHPDTGDIYPTRTLC